MFSLWHAKETALQESRQQALTIAKQLAEQQTALLKEIENFTVQLAQLINEDITRSNQGCPDYLLKIQKLNPEIANIGIVNLQGDATCIIKGRANINIATASIFKML